MPRKYISTYTGRTYWSQYEDNLPGLGSSVKYILPAQLPFTFSITFGISAISEGFCGFLRV